MDREALIELGERAVAALNESYRTRDLTAWRRFVEAEFHPEIEIDAGSTAFTEGEWRGHEGVVAFVGNQMDVLDGMWLRIDEYIHLRPPGSYCIVKDTNLNGHPVIPRFGPGPVEAVEAFLAERDDFTQDRSLEELMVTAAPKGFLYRTR